MNTRIKVSLPRFLPSTATRNEAIKQKIMATLNNNMKNPKMMQFGGQWVKNGDKLQLNRSILKRLAIFPKNRKPLFLHYDKKNISGCVSVSNLVARLYNFIPKINFGVYY